MISSLTVGLTGLFLLATLAARWLNNRHDPREPPNVNTAIPIIGHLLGMMKHGHRYYLVAGGEHPPEIFSLDLLLTKSYIVTSPKLLQPIMRQSRLISFEANLNAIVTNMLGVEGPSVRQFMQKESGGDGLNGDILNAMHSALLGPGLESMVATALKYLVPVVDQLENTNGPINLIHWTRHGITMASTEAAYGTTNPYNDEGAADAFWDWEDYVAFLMPGVLPELIAKKSLGGREKLVKCYERYYKNGCPEDASLMIKARHRVHMEAQTPWIDFLRLEASISFGLLSNSIPATFWAIFELFSRPDVVRELRKELQDEGLIIEHRGGEEIYQVDVESLRTRCFHFFSAFQELMRLRMIAANTRTIVKDVMLDDRYLLRKGNILQISALHFNRNQAVWGENADDFDSKRFIGKDPKTFKGNYVTWGSAPNYCPGRHFASAEIIGLVAMLVLRYDFEAVNGWVEPELNALALTAAVAQPKGHYPIIVKPVEEYRNKKWAFKVPEGLGKFNLVIA